MTVAVAFPGQGAYTAESARSLSESFPAVAEVYAEVDEGARAAGSAPVSQLLLAAQPPSAGQLVAESPESLQLAIYAVSVAIARLVTPAAGWSGVRLGHSLGEIAALQSAGAFTVTDGARVVAHRARALRSVDGQGGMLALACDRQRARDLLAVVGSSDLAVAAVNAPRQTVVSGPHADLATLTEVAKALRIGATALPSPYAFHNPRLSEVAADFAARIAGVPVGERHGPVYSPILGRFYEPGDDIRSLVAGHLVASVDFAGAVRQLRAAGTTIFVECASGSSLGALAVRSAEGLESTTAAQRGNEIASVETTRAVLGGGEVPASEPEPIVTWRPAPVPEPVPAPVLVSVPAAAPVAGRGDLFTELSAMYAEALEYPAEVFTEDVALEAELGVDSVKQTELFARTVERYQLPLPTEAVQLAQFDTMGKVVDLVWSLMSPNAALAPAPVPSPAPAPVPARPVAEESAAPGPTPQVAGRSDLFIELSAMYAEALEYPAEVFTEDVALEAELGVDSVKQTELFARTVERYQLPLPTEAVQLAQFDTMGKVVDLVWSLMSAVGVPQASSVRSAA